MANEEHIKLLEQGVEVWNRWRAENPDIRPDLRRAGLREANLWGSDLSRVDLSRADLSGAILGGADFSGADLRAASLGEAYLSAADLNEAILRGADLHKVDLSIVDLTGADLSWSILREADLSGANLRGTILRKVELNEANFSNTQVAFTVFSDVNLSVAIGLDTAAHEGPSYIDIRTIYRSKGKIPEAFLRGAGLPDNFISYMASLAGEAIQYHTCFISYSHKDEVFARCLHNDLQRSGVRCWFAPEDIRGGDKLYDQIDQAIRLHDKLLLVLSEHSIQSEWVMTEIRRARMAEIRDERRKLFPVRLVDWRRIKDWECFDADTGKDLAVEVREYFIPDFSNWEDRDAYQQAFDRLLRDLKAEEG
jgi:hypothetical protein